jgi:hypothetical protein
MEFQGNNKMKKYCTFSIFLFLLVFCKVQAQQSINGQLSIWGNYNPNNHLPFFTGIRYIPTLQVEKKIKNQHLFDAEISVNGNVVLGTNFYNETTTQQNIKPYRAWLRYTSKQSEIRLGLQKINFGSASILRPLMWFDQIDPTDPLQLTSGVWGLLSRYYFLNNANAWVWILVANKELKTWEVGSTNQHYPEWGTRLQLPLKKGETAFTYHYRQVEKNQMFVSKDLAENRIGVDAKVDLHVGLYFEAVWINKNKNIGQFTNQEICTLGMDYTFPMGNGLHLLVEHLFFAFDEKAFAFSNINSLSAMSLTYPLGLIDNINGVFYL